MLQAGTFHEFNVRSVVNPQSTLVNDFGYEITINTDELPAGIAPGTPVRVFLYRDSENRLIATTTGQPLITLHTFAYLEVADVSEHGAFLKWGMPKDLFVPFREQAQKMEPGKKYLVFMYLDDENERLVASSKINKFIRQDPEEDVVDFAFNAEVDVLVCESTKMGINVIVNNRYKGLVYENEIYKPVHLGDRVRGYVKAVREDLKIDISLQKLGYGRVVRTADPILENLKAHKGFLPLTDNSPPEEISRMLGISKKTFKKAIGALYKKRLIRIEADGIYLVP